MTKITAIIPTLNEEIHIEAAIESVSFADEIIVIDSYSSDNTVQLAEKQNVKIIKRKFDDFSSQKNFAIQQAKHPWIYILDADERVPLKVVKEILKVVKRPKGKVGFYIKRSFYFAGRNLKYGGCQRDKVVRLFLKECCTYKGTVHEKIEAEGELGFLKHKIEHYSYRSHKHYISKLDFYGSLRAQEYFLSGKKINAFHFYIKPIVRFFIHYIIRLGFLDGYQGFVFAKLQAYSVSARYQELRILYKNNS